MTYVTWHGRDDKSGWDTSAYMDGLFKAQWLGQGAGIAEYSYGYHLPLLFLIDRLAMRLGLSPLHAIKLVNWVLLLGVFGAARAAFAHLGLLSRIHGVAMLYLALAIPLNVFLAHSVHMESPVLLSWAVILWGAFKLVRPRRDYDLLTGFGLIVIGAVFGLYCKYSALLNLTIPLLGALFLTKKKDTGRLWLAILAAEGLSLLVVWPYYYFRNYLFIGQFIPSNTEVFWPLKALNANQRIWRDEHPGAFFSELFSPRDFGLDRYSAHYHLHFIWYDLWHRDQLIGQSHLLANFMGDIYLFGFAGLTLLGLAWIFGRLFEASLMQRFCLLLVSFSFIQLAAAVDYAWQNPNGLMMSVKAIYLTPICFTVGALSVTGFSVLMRPILYRRFYRIYAGILLLGVGALMALNYLFVIY